MFIFRCPALFFHIIIDQIKVTFQMLHGAWHIAKMPKPMVSIFGGARLSQDDPYALKASEIAHKLTKNNISVITGGGPGIMQAASCGAVKSKELRNLGIGVQGLPEGANLCVQHYVNTKYFYARKWLLMRYSTAFAVFPGGFGTVDEMAEVITLIQTKKLVSRPVFLIGKVYWQPFMDWIEQSALKTKLISKEDMQLLSLVDDMDQLFCSLRDECLLQNQKKKDNK